MLQLMPECRSVQDLQVTNHGADALSPLFVHAKKASQGGSTAPPRMSAADILWLIAEQSLIALRPAS